MTALLRLLNACLADAHDYGLLKAAARARHALAIGEAPAALVWLDLAERYGALALVDEWGRHPKDADVVLRGSIDVLALARELVEPEPEAAAGILGDVPDILAVHRNFLRT
jgi:hypothetical protein